MRKLSPRGAAPVSVVAVVALLVTATPAFASDGGWDVELRVAQVVPIEEDGWIAGVAGLGSGTTNLVDVHSAVAVELAAKARVGSRFDLAVAAGYAEHDVELDVFMGGEVPLGSTDVIHVHVTGLFEAASWGRSTLALGPVVGLAAVDDLDVDPTARSVEGVLDVAMDAALLFGAEARLDTSLGSRGWYFSSGVRYLLGDADMEVFTDSDASGPSTSGRVLAARGDAELDPLVVSFGVGRRF